MADKPTYSGVLAEPIPAKLFAAPTIVKGRGEQTIEVATLLLEKVEALCEHYGCDIKLVASKEHLLELGSKYVPGFQVENRRPNSGRKANWDDFQFARLWILHRAMMATNPRLSQTDALRNIARKHRNQFGVGFERLKEQLPKARQSPLVQMLESANEEDRKFAWNFLGSHQPTK